MKLVEARSAFREQKPVEPDPEIDPVTRKQGPWWVTWTEQTPTSKRFQSAGPFHKRADAMKAEAELPAHYKARSYTSTFPPLKNRKFITRVKRPLATSECTTCGNEISSSCCRNPTLDPGGAKGPDVCTHRGGCKDWCDGIYFDKADGFHKAVPGDWEYDDLAKEP